MPELIIHSAGRSYTLAIRKGEILLDSLARHGFEVHAPCGRNGTCGKCKVYIKDRGCFVTACNYLVKEDLELILPDPAEVAVLSNQYIYSRKPACSPGDAVCLSKNPLGLAIDVGTTTLVFQLVELTTGSLMETYTSLNPQIKFGADVISRINYDITNNDGVQILQSEIIEKLNAQLSEIYDKGRITPHDLVKISVCGNTTMLHLFLGISPESLAFFPFTPVFTDQKKVKSSELNINIHPEGEVLLMPSLSAYVGADIVAGIASLDPVKAQKTYLFIDAGTNGEIALITPDRILCCATAAGPAFEGSNIVCGMASLPGAIYRYEASGQYRTIGHVPPSGICGSGLIDLAARLLKMGVISSDGFMKEMFVVVPDKETGFSGDIYITPRDIREIQLAKSAIVTGIHLLVEQSGLSLDEVDALYMAGGFGNYIRTESAVTIGLIPQELQNKVFPIGNTAVTGATLAVVSQDFVQIIHDIKNRMTFFELANDERFFAEFAMNMGFPKGNGCVDAQ